MRGGARVKEALGFVTLLWNHPVLTGLFLLIFTPPFFPLLVYFSPLLMSTALCVVALVSVGSQMEKIKAEGGPGQQLESHLAREHGVSSWSDHRYGGGGGGGGESNRHRNLYANIHVVPATPPTSWQETTSRSITAAPPVVQLESNRRDPQTPDTAESDEDWWDTWVREYESRPGWGDQEDPQPFRTPARIPADVTGAPAKDDTPSMAPPLKPEVENRPVAAAAVVAPIPAAAAPVAAAAAAAGASVSVSVVKNRQEAASRTLPATSTSRSPHEEVVVSVKVTDYVSTLAPIRTGRETDQQQGDRIGKTPQEILKVGVPAAPRVSDVQALQSIEKLLEMEIGGSTVPATRNERRPPSPGLSAGKGIAAVEMSKSGADQDVIAGEPPLLRHLKTSRSESKHSRNSSAYSPLPGRSRGAGVMAEKVQPPPQFSPRLLQSLQPLPPGKGKVSPRPLPNSSAVPLGNPVEKIPQWVYDGIPKERADKQAMKAETAEEKNIRAFEQAVKVLSYTRRRTHARRSVPIPVDTAKSLPPSENPPSELLPSRTEDNPAAATDRAPDPHRTDSATPPAMPTPRASANPNAPSVAASPRTALSPAGTRAAPGASSSPAANSNAPSAAASPGVPSAPAANPNGSSVAAASPRIPSSPAPIPSGASVTAASPRIPPSPASNPVAASPRVPSPPALNPHGSSVAASPRIPSSPALNPHVSSVAASPRIPSSPALNPHVSSVAASPRIPSSPALNPHVSSVAASPRIPSSPALNPSAAASPRIPSSPALNPSVAASPRVAASPPKAPRAPSPQSASIASSPRTMGASPTPPQKAPSPRRASRASSPSIGSTPWPASSPSPQKPAAPPAPQKPSSPSMPHPRRRRQQSFKHGTTPIRIEGPAYYDTPADEKEDSDTADYVPIEKEVIKEAVVAEADDWARINSSLRRSSNSRRRLEPRRVVTSLDADDMFCLKKSLSMRNGQTIKFVDSSSTTDDERESITPRSSRRSMGRIIKPLVWRSRSVQPREDSD